MAIIAGFRGMGKTWLAQHMDGVIEISDAQYRWLLPEKAKSEPELSPDEVRSRCYPEFRGFFYPTNMVLDILKAEMEYPYVIIPCDDAVLGMLEFDIHRQDVCLVYPDDAFAEELGKEQSQRIFDRGSGDSSEKTFSNLWSLYLSVLEEKGGHHFRLAKGEFLADKWAEITATLATDEPPLVSAKAIARLKEKLEAQKKRPMVLFHFGNATDHILPILGVGDSAIRRQLDEIGQACLKAGHTTLLLVIDDPERYSPLRESPRLVRTTTVKEFLDVIAEDAHQAVQP